MAAQQRALAPRRAPDAQTIEKAHGRVEIRELWVVAAGELASYLDNEYGWKQVVQIGWLRRWRRRRTDRYWSVEQVTVVASLPMSAQMWLASMRVHWSIENKVHRPRDEAMQEDRLHGRAIGVILAVCRNIVLNLIRTHIPATYLPEARNRVSANIQRPLAWMQRPLKN